MKMTYLIILLAGTSCYPMPYKPSGFQIGSPVSPRAYDQSNSKFDFSKCPYRFAKDQNSRQIAEVAALMQLKCGTTVKEIVDFAQASFLN